MNIREMILTGVYEAIAEMKKTAINDLTVALDDVERAIVRLGNKAHYEKVAVKVDGIIDVDAVESDVPVTLERLTRYYTAVHSFDPAQDEVQIINESLDVVDLDAWELVNLPIVVTTEDVVENVSELAS